jgi:hypothetical protein
MSADAKVWFDSETMGGRWEGIHDGCPTPNIHWGTAYEFSAVVRVIEQCMGQSLRWELRTYPDGLGLAGYIA